MEQGIENKNIQQTPKWVVVLAIWLILFGVLGGWNGVKALSQMGQIDWARAAQSEGVDVNILKSVTYLQICLYLALGVALIASAIGIWKMKKWGTIIYGAFFSIYTLGLILQMVKLGQQSQSNLEIGTLVFWAIHIGLGIGLVILWQKGKLT